MNYLTAVQVGSDLESRERGSGLLALPYGDLRVALTVVRGHVLAGDGGSVLATRSALLLRHPVSSFLGSCRANYINMVQYEHAGGKCSTQGENASTERRKLRSLLR